MRKSIRITAMLLAGIALGGCSTSPATGPSGPSGLGSELVGTWKADTSITISAGIMSVPLTATALTTFAADSTFAAYFDGDSILGTVLQGHLFHETGIWKAKGPDTVVVLPLHCESADTATTKIAGIISMSLPFHSAGTGYVANTLGVSACPDSMVIASHPVAGVVHFTMPVNLPQVGKANWHLTFVKQP